MLKALQNLLKEDTILIESNLIKKSGGEMKNKIKWKIGEKNTFTDRFIIICLIVVSIGLWFSPSAYKTKLEVHPYDDIYLTYLQQGDYVIYFDYDDSPKDNYLVISSDTVITEYNKAGMEFLRLAIDSEKGSMKASFHLDQDTRKIHIYPEKLNELGNCITAMTVQSVALQDRDNYFLSMLCVASAVFLLLLKKYYSDKNIRESGLVLAIGMLSCIPLLSSYLIDGNDLYIHLARIEGIYQGIGNGEFPVYINTVMMSGYGNLSASMYPQLFLYPLSILRAMGVSLYLCYKLLLVLINIMTAFFSFYAVKNITKSEKAAFLACVFYTLSLYRMNDMYFRAALGETMALTFLPLVLWGAYELLWGNSKKWYILALGMSGVIEGHVLTVEMCILFLLFEGVCMLIYSRTEKISVRIVNGIKAICLTCLLNAFFIVPFLFFSGEDLQVFTNMPNEVAGTGAYFSQMFALFPGTAGIDRSDGVANGEMPMTIGGVLLAGIIMFFMVCREKRERDTAISIGKHCIYMGAMALYMASWIFPWETISRNAFVSQIVGSLQFAWRFLGPATLFLSVASAIGIVKYTENKKNGKWVAGIVCAAALASTFYFMDMLVQEAPQVADKMEIAESDLCDALYMYSNGDKFEALQLDYRRNMAVVKSYLGTEITCENYVKKGTNISVDIAASGAILENDYIQFPLYYFPGYEIEIDGQKVDAEVKNRLVAYPVPDGRVHIEVKYNPPVIFDIANMITLFTVISMTGYGIFVSLRRRKENEVQENRILSA